MVRRWVRRGGIVGRLLEGGPFHISVREGPPVAVRVGREISSGQESRAHQKNKEKRHWYEDSTPDRSGHAR
jgi:hypothetical protein